MHHAALLAIALAACGRDYTLNTDASASGEPDIAVEPAQLLFENVPTGETATDTFTIRNEGDAALDVNAIEMRGSSAFSLLTPLPLRVEPGASTAVEVAYEPVHTLDEGSARIYSTDPDTPELSVELTGSWAVPVLSIDPPEWDFGDLVPGCVDTLDVTLANVGSATLTVDEVLHTGEGFELAGLPELPLDLEPGGTADLEVRFAPSTDGAFSGTLWVSSNDPGGRKTATWTGTGDEDGVCVTVDEGDSTTVSLELTGDYEMADVAFLIDTTGSMGSTATAVADEFASISSSLQARIPDITFGVATFEDYNFGSMGAGRDKPFTLHQQQTSDFARVQSALSGDVTIHDGADSPEATLEALYQAAAGLGYDQGCDGGYDATDDVPPFLAGASDAFGGAVDGVADPTTPDGGSVGGFGFREGILPIVIYATDTALRDPEAGYATPGGCPLDAGSSDVIAALNAIGAHVIGVAVGLSQGSDPFRQMAAIAEGTGSYGDMDGDGASEPAVITWNGSSADFRNAVVRAVQGLIDEAVFDEVRLEVVADEYGMVRSISPEAYADVTAGTPLEFDVDIEGTVASGPSDRTVEIDLALVGTIDDEEVTLDEAAIYVMVPAQ